MAKFHPHVEQGSAEWFRLRAGVPTASEFDKIITPARGDLSEQRKRYAARLIAQRLLRWQPESLDTIEHIANGKADEPAAVAQFEFVQDATTQQVGFVTTEDGRFGASPDRVIGLHERSCDLTIEIKVPSIPVQMERLLFGPGAAYRCQVQGQLYVCEADKAVFYSYSQRMPAYLKETGRDEVFLAKLKDCLEQFSDELEEWTEQARRLGDWQAFAETVLPPLDAGLMREEELSGG